MKVVGLITEYNPFHNGHKYHIEEARRITGADYVIAVMSGNFVQRGAPALIDKYSRTRMALSNGVDLLLELPVCYATGSAELFAHGAVSLLDNLGIVDYLCFGSESGDINLLNKTVDLMINTPASYDENIQVYQKSGLSYPAAREKALITSAALPQKADRMVLSKVLSEPNNILGLEYLKAIHNLNSSIQPVTLRRKEAHYHDFTLSVPQPASNTDRSEYPTADNTVISSATAIRKAINLLEHPDKRELEEISHSVPSDVYQILSEQYLKTCPVTEEDFAQIIRYKLLTEDNISLASYSDISADLADRLKNQTDLNLKLTELMNQIKTKNLTLTRVNRSLIHLLLNIRTKDMEEYKAHGYTSYARVLGMKEDATPLLRKVRQTSRFPVITRAAKAEEILQSIERRLFASDIYAAHLYNQAVYNKYGVKLPNEYRRGIMIV